VIDLSCPAPIGGVRSAPLRNPAAPTSR